MPHHRAREPALLLLTMLLACHQDAMPSPDGGGTAGAGSAGAGAGGRATPLAGQGGSQGGHQAGTTSGPRDAAVDAPAPPPDAGPRDAPTITDARTTDTRLSGGALPIIPGAVGFGMDTVAGSGRHLTPPRTTVFRVTTLADAGTGSLRACIEAQGPRTCVFETSGVIEATTNLQVDNPYLTVAGQTAPGQGIALAGAGIKVRASHVLIQHVRVRVGDRPAGPPVHSRDALAISNSTAVPTHVVIDHTSLAFSTDETAEVWFDAGDITFRRCMFGPPLHDSIHIDENATATDPHGYGPILGPGTGRVTLVENLFAHQWDRNPMTRIAALAMVNNVIYNWGAIGVDLRGDTPGFPHNNLVGNVFIAGADSRAAPPISVHPTMANRGRAFLLDNRLGTSVPANQWSLANNGAGASVVADAVLPMAWPAGLIARPAANGESDVLADVGAMPRARDTLDAAIVEQVRARSGRIINCVSGDGSDRCMKNALGWPQIPVVKRTLTPPAEPTGDADRDGYTNLENWLHGF